MPAQKPAASLTRTVVFTAITTVMILGFNLISGVLVARGLGPSGRGEVAFLLTITQIVGWLAGLGLTEGFIYVAAKQTSAPSKVLSTALITVPVLGVLGFAVLELVLPMLLSSQSDAFLHLGRLYAVAVFINVADGVLFGVLAGREDFSGCNIYRLMQACLYVCVLVTLIVVDRMSPGTVIVASAAASGVAVLWMVRRLVRRSGLARPSMQLWSSAARFGVRAQGSLIGSLGAGRLDLILLPSVLTSASIGLYSVSTNTSSIVGTIAGSLSIVVLPTAVRKGGAEAVRFVGRMLRLVFVTGTMMALPLFALAPFLLRLVYGSEFEAAATSLRILLPGVVMAACGKVLEGALQSKNRPLAASIGQLVALVVTVVGLVLTLERYGIVGAAWTTTVAYTTAFVISLGFLRAGDDFSLRAVFVGSELRGDLAVIMHKVTQGVRRGGREAAPAEQQEASADTAETSVDPVE